MRLYELAREIGVNSDDLLKVSQELKLKPKNRLGGLEPAEEAMLRKEAVARGLKSQAAKPGAKPPSRKQPSAAKPKASAPAASQPAAPAAAPTPIPAAPPAPAKPSEAAKPKLPVAKPQLPVDEESAEAQRRAAQRRKGKTGTPKVEEEDISQIIGPVVGRFIPPSTIQRYPRRQMRHARPKLRHTVVPEKPTVETLTAPMSIKDLSAKLGIRANQIIAKLMQLGVMATINAVLNAEQLELMASEFGFKLTVQEAATAEDAVKVDPTVPDKPEDLKPRSPVVTFLGHVDHGKTSLLDRIRKTDVAAHEHGGITQHIGAYRVTIGGKTVVFLDTPGHEAFTAMRARGANVTDIAVLVVAADDGVMPQTEEAIDHARAAGVPIVVAINKCDKPEANPQRVRQELTTLGLQPEEWGGDTICVDVSAITGKGVDDLIEMLSLVAELRELKSNPTKPARGTVLDAQMSGSRGPVVTVLIQEGTLKIGDVMVCGGAFGRVKALYDDKGRSIREAGPAFPVAISGLNDLPEAGDHLVVLDDFQKARAVAEERQVKAREAAVNQRAHVSLENFFASIEAGRVKELLLIVKGDVRGTLEATTKILSGMSAPGVKVRVLRSSVGGISTSDILLAEASDAIVVGMNVVPDPSARALAEQLGVSIHTYNVIYRLKEEIEKALIGMLTPEEREHVVGHAEVRQVFHISRIGSIAGCYVRDGSIARANKVRLLRDNTIIHDGRIGSLRREKDDVREVREGFECGIHIENYDDVKTGDVIESYLIEKIAPTLGAGTATA